MNKTKARMEVPQLPSKEIKERESLYRKDLGDFKSGLIAGERFKKDGIKKLAKDLEEAETVDTHLISIRIKSDLKEIIDRNLLAYHYINATLEDKYKRPQKPRVSSQNESNKNVSFSQSDTSASTTTLSTTTSQPAAQTTEQSKPSPQTIEEERRHDTFVDDLYHHARTLIEMITGYNESQYLKSNDNFKLVADTRQFRFDLVTRLSELDAKTVYGDMRSLAMLVNDLLKHLDNNLDARRKKEHITSE